MIIFKKAGALHHYLTKARQWGKTIGFVPTMGALHPGHISLLHQARKPNALLVCSIFVNPTQFNNPDDLAHYPVTLEKDIQALIAAGCNILFLPSIKEIYPNGFHQKHYDLGPLEHVLEGEYRPGHFQGVCQVVDRLLETVVPDDLYMGQKDFQQCMVIRRLLDITGRENQVRLQVVPTMREEDGLAMSSRNLRLDPAQRKTASFIYTVLDFLRQNKDTLPPETLELEATEQLASRGFAVDYVRIVNAASLGRPENSSQRVALVAAALGPVRLIDNMLLN